jgi:hypothetical protein
MTSPICEVSDREFASFDSSFLTRVKILAATS